MATTPLLLLLLLWICPGDASVQQHTTWDYSNTELWKSQFKQFCTGRKQSPINLGLGHSTRTEIPEYDFEQEESSSYTVQASNNGLTLTITLPKIRMGLGKEMFYSAAQLHWHWGLDDSRGSEHRVDNKPYPLEGHMVFWNSRDYPSLSKAQHAVGGLAVLGVFYEKSAHDNPLLAVIDPAFDRLRNGGETNVSVNASSLNLLESFLPAKKTEFYRYEGSLTTPECNENVLWTVYRDTVGVSERQLRRLRSLRFGDGSPMGDNFRRPQPLNSLRRPGADRILFRNFGHQTVTGIRVLRDNPNSASAIRPAFAAIAVAAVLCFDRLHSL